MRRYETLINVIHSHVVFLYRFVKTMFIFPNSREKLQLEFFLPWRVVLLNVGAESNNSVTCYIRYGSVFPRIRDQRMARI